MTDAAGPCLQHAERQGTPCRRCGTFRCEDCLRDGLCPSCAEAAGPRPPAPGDAVGFGPRAGARFIDLLVGQAAGWAGGFAAGVVLVLLEQAGLIRTGWMERLGGSAGFGMLTGVVSTIAGASVSTWICGASVCKAILGLQVVQSSGERARLGAAALREAAFLLDSFFFGLVAYSAMEKSSLQQRHGDRWADTVVVRRKTLSGAVAASLPVLLLGLGLGLAVEAVVLCVFSVLSAM